MLLKFKTDGKWTGGLGNPDYVVKAGVPIDVCAETAKLALDSGRAEKVEIRPNLTDKSKAEVNPAKKDKRRARKK